MNIFKKIVIHDNHALSFARMPIVFIKERLDLLVNRIFSVYKDQTIYTWELTVYNGITILTLLFET